MQNWKFSSFPYLWDMWDNNVELESLKKGAQTVYPEKDTMVPYSL